jgi:hypothetical protein
MYFSKHLENLKSLNLPPDQFVVVSSGSLAIRGIREARDVDIVVTPELWSILAQKYGVEIKDNVEIIELGNDIETLGKGSWFTKESLIKPQEIFDEADVFEGIKFMNLSQLRKIKQEKGREKDLNDVKLIDEYLVKNPQVV